MVHPVLLACVSVSAAVLPLLPLGFGRGGGKQAVPAVKAKSEEPSSSSSDDPLPLEVARFLATGSGVRWLVETLKDWPGLLGGARDRIEDTLDDAKQQIRRAPHHINGFVVGEYKKLVRSEMGKRLINRAHAAEDAIADPLSVPLYVVEDIVRLRLHQLVTRNWRPVTWRICVHASAMCAAMHLAKLLVKRAVRGRPRAERTVAYVCDVLLPTSFYGPVAGCGVVVLQLVDQLRGEDRRVVQVGGGGGGGGGGGRRRKGGSSGSGSGGSSSSLATTD